jgi:hypothetical protein
MVPSEAERISAHGLQRKLSLIHGIVPLFIVVMYNFI